MITLPVDKAGKDYIPYTKTNTFSSKGRATRIMGIKTGRIHHLQSDNQYRAFMYFEWSDRVIDIRESYPLLDIMEVIDDKKDLRFDRFKDKEKDKQFILTTNFLLTVDMGERELEYVARTVKNTSELSRTITAEKLEIERRYWAAKGIEWRLITEKELDKQYVKNVEFTRETLLQNQYRREDLQDMGEDMILVLMNSTDCPLRQVIKDYETVKGLDEGTGMFVFRYLIAMKKIQINMFKKLDMNKKVSEVLIWR